MFPQMMIGRYLPVILIVIGIVAAFVLLHVGLPFVVSLAVIGALALFIVAVITAWGVVERRITTGRWKRASVRNIL